MALRRRFKVRMVCGSRLSHLLIGNELSTPARVEMKWLLNVWMARLALLRWWMLGGGEFDGASVAADGGFELARCLVVEDVPVYVNDLGVFPTLVNVLVGFDEIVGFARFHALCVDVVSIKFNGHHEIFVSSS